MLPKNSDLFIDLTEIERLFINPEAYPWDALVAMMAFMRACTGDHMAVPSVEPTQEWPNVLPSFNRDKKDPSTPINFITMDRVVHIRGGKGLKCDPDAYIQGPVAFGEGVRLRKGAVVTGPSYIGDGVMIGQGCKVKCSIIRAGAQIEYCTRVAHAILGRGVFIGANAVLCDRILDEDGPQKRLTIPSYGDVATPGLRELGLIAGDGCRIGGGAVVLAGAVFYPKSSVREGSHILERGVVIPPTIGVNIRR